MNDEVKYFWFEQHPEKKGIFLFLIAYKDYNISLVKLSF